MFWKEAVAKSNVGMATRKQLTGAGYESWYVYANEVCMKFTIEGAKYISAEHYEHLLDWKPLQEE